MTEFKKILVPTDFSEISKSAFSFAETIAKHYHSTIDFLHVTPTLKYFSESLASLDTPFDMEEDIYPRAQKETKHKLNHLMDDYLREEHRGQAIVQISAKPSTAITDHARNNDYDLIVIASQGADKTSLLRGSVTEKVIRHSRVPVLAINRQSAADNMKRIIFPTDGSAISFTAFPLAVSLAKIYEAEITLLHVIELYGSALEYREEWNPEKTENENIYEGLMQQLKDFLKEDRGNEITLRKGEEEFEDELVVQDGPSSSSIPIKTAIRRGITAHAGIEEFAEDNSDLVVMTTHGDTGLARFFLGSTTERISQHLDKPLLTVKPSKDKLK